MLRRRRVLFVRRGRGWSVLQKLPIAAARVYMEQLARERWELNEFWEMIQ